MSRPPATVSVDLDAPDVHLAGYGVRDADPDPRVWTVALPRLLSRLQIHGLRATFFVVARDAVERAPFLHALEAAGHEVASHTLTHPPAFARLPRAEQLHELRESKRRLEHATGRDVAGFRAPNFDLDRRALATVAECGYRYDASAYPSPILLAAPIVLAARARRIAEAFRPWRGPFTLQRAPHRVRAGGREILEFPLAVTPGARLPVYHTPRYLSGGAGFLRRLEGFASRGEPLSYILHGVDALSVETDGLDPRLAAHPGMTLPLEEKLELLDEVLDRIARGFEARPFRERLSEA